jgi:type I phosphodiesterase/nucleotide pyrophosphatase
VPASAGQRTRLLVALLAIAACCVVAAPPAGAVTRPLVYVVVIDGVGGNQIDAGKAPFISSLLRGDGARATYYRESRAIMPALTNPNHTAMMSGAYSDINGTPGDGFAIYAPLLPNTCQTRGAVDEGRPPTETQGQDGRCPTEVLFEAIKRQGNPDGLVTAALFGKSKLGRIFSGKNANPRGRDVDYVWAPCGGAPRPEDREYCDPDARVDPVPGVMDRTLDDSLVMGHVLRTIRQGVPVGRSMRRPDFTFVNLPQVDNAGHAAGTDPEMVMTPAFEGPFGELRYERAIGLADDEVRLLVSELRSRGDWGRTVLILLSDHSFDTVTNLVSMTSTFTNAGISRDDFVAPNGNSGADLVFLTNRKSPRRFELLKRMRQAALATGAVQEVLYREPNPLDGGGAHTIDGAHPAWRAAGTRMGDLLVTAKPGTGFGEPSATGDPFHGRHGSPHTLDNFFAVVGGSDFVRQQALSGQSRPPFFDDTALNPRQSENVDVASTVMGLFGLFSTRNNAGRFLAESFNLGRLPGGGAPAISPKLRVRQLTRLFDRRGRRLRPRLIRYRLSWAGVPNIRYDIQVRDGRRTRTLLSRTTRTSVDYSRPYGRYVTIRLRSYSAADVPSRFTVRPLGTRPRG